eukprot:3745368-Alexandrium_andersonii.AAC.1
MTDPLNLRRREAPRLLDTLLLRPRGRWVHLGGPGRIVLGRAVVADLVEAGVCEQADVAVRARPPRGTR